MGKQGFNPLAKNGAAVGDPAGAASKSRCQALLQARDFAGLERCASAALKTEDDPFLWSSLATARKAQGDLTGARDAFAQTARLTPKDPTAHANLAALEIMLGREDRAETAARHALSLNPDMPTALNVLGLALHQIGLSEEAERHFRRALELDPDNKNVLQNLATLLTATSDKTAARETFERLLQLSPDNAEAYFHLAQAHRFNALSDPLLAALSAQYQKHTAPEAREKIAFALAKAFEDLGEYEATFQLLSEANSARKARTGYRFEADAALFKLFLSCAPKILAQPPARPRPDGPQPIFILGMPRSGTSLLSQIITAHPQVSGGVELPYAARYGEALCRGTAEVSPESIATFRDAYLDALARHADDHAYVVDKMPQNFVLLPLLARAFPDAPILHSLRDPIATCWSNFRQFFPSDSLRYSCDLTDIRGYYSLYAMMMESYGQAMPGRIIGVSYEELTEDPQQAIPDLIDRIGLPWDAACLAPERNTTPMRTASANQVRKGIYKGSSQNWAPYDALIAGAFDGLADLPR